MPTASPGQTCEQFIGSNPATDARSFPISIFLIYNLFICFYLCHSSLIFFYFSYLFSFIYSFL